MSERKKELETTKKLLRSMLIASKTGYPLNALNKAFKDEITGHYLPLEKLGYSSLEQFLEAIPDAVSLEKRADGKTVVKGVPDRANMHIAKLVKEQKDYSPGGNNKNRFFNRPHQSRFSSSAKSHPKVVPFTVQTKVSALMKNNREGLSMGEFEAKYLEVYKEPINFKTYGFSTSIELLSHMKDLVHVRQTGNGAYRVVPTLSKIQEWEKEANKPTKTLAASPRPIISHELRSNLEAFISRYPSGIGLPDFQAQFRKQFGPLDLQSLGCQSVAQFCMLLSDIFSMKNCPGEQMGGWTVYPKGALDGPTTSTLIEDVNSNIRRVLRDFHDGLEISSFPQKYKEICGASLELCGYGSLSDLFASIPFVECISINHPITQQNKSIVRMKQKDLKEEKLKFHTISKKGKDTSNVIITNLADSVAENDLTTLFSFHGPVLCAKILKHEKKAVVTMQTSEDAKRAADEFNNELLDGSVIQCFIEEDSPKKKRPSSSEPGSAPTSPSVDSHIPDQGPIMPVKLPPSLKVGEYIDILVAEVFSPHHFYFQLKSNAEQLNSMMWDLDDFYKCENGVSDGYLLADSDCKSGMVVAALYFDDWHRAVILECDLVRDVFKIDYFDYGTPAEVPRSHLRLLDRRFAQLPAQAIRGKLAHIRPIFDDWSSESGVYFLDLVKRTNDHGIVAEVRGVAKSTTAVSVWMYDTVTNELPTGIQINEKLVERGFAELCSDVEDDEDELEKAIARSNYRQLELARPQKPLRIPCEAEDTKVVLETFDKSHGSDNSGPKSAFTPIRKHSVETKPLIASPCRPNPQPHLSTSRPSSVEIEKIRVIDSCESHVIFLDGMSYMTSAEISALIPKFKKKDVLGKMLSLRKVKIDSLKATPETHVELFENCVLEEVLGIENENGEVVSQLTLYRVQKISQILGLFHPDCSSQLIAVLNQYSR